MTETASKTDFSPPTPSCPPSGETRQIAPSQRLTARNLEEEYLFLPGTGFSVLKQIHNFITVYQRVIQEGHSFAQALGEALNNVTEDIAHFKWEYIKRQGVLANPVGFAEVDGQERLVGTRYGKRPLLEAISKDERRGSVYDAVENVEQALLGAEVGTTAVIANPKGATGIRADNGKWITYEESQTCVFQVTENGLTSYTFITTTEEEENKQLMIKLGVGEDAYTGSWGELDQVSRIVSHPAILSPDHKYASPEKVLNLLEEVMKRPLANSIRNKTFAQMRQELSQGSGLLVVDGVCQSLTERLINNVHNLSPQLVRELQNLSDDWSTLSPEQLFAISPSLKLVAQQLGKTVLNLSYTERTGTIPVSEMTGAQYQQEFVVVKALTGCAGGGGVMFTPFGGIAASLSEKCQKIKCGKPGCNWEASDEEARKIARKDITCCPKCGWKPG